MTKRKLRKAVDGLDLAKKNRDYEIPGILGFVIGGKETVEVPNREGYVYVRLRNNTNELIQAYNEKVSPVYNLPVLVTRDEVDKGRYKISGRDLGKYNNWGTSPYLPRHGNQHSFNPEGSGGGDIVWTYSRQFMPLLGRPSGSVGSMNIIVEPYSYFIGNDNWVYAGDTGTASFAPYKPTGSSARMVLVYLDNSGNPTLLGGSTYFNTSITGTSEVLQYIPNLPASASLPICGVRLLSGTSKIVWENIYDLRPIASSTPMSFLRLSDTPTSYVGEASKFVKVNVGETGLEFVTGTAGVGSFLELTDTPNSYTGSSLRPVRVNSTFTGLEFQDRYQRTYTVDPAGNGDFTTLSSALASITDAAANKRYRILVYGDVTETGTVNLRNYIDVEGIDEASITINTNSNVDGVVIGTGSFDGFVLTLRNLRIYRSGVTSGATYALNDNFNAVFYSGNLKIESVKAYNQTTVGIGHGMRTGYYSNAIFKNCEFTGNNVSSAHGGVMDTVSVATFFSCIFTAGSSGTSYGVNTASASDVTMYNCTATGGRGSGGLNHGIYISNSSKGTYTSCKFVGGVGNNTHGAMTDYDSTPKFIGCTMIGGAGLITAGFYAYRTSIPTLISCNVSAGATAGLGYGLFAGVSAAVKVDGSTIVGGSSGTLSYAAYLADSAFVTFDNCSLTPGLGTNSYGVHVAGGASVKLNGCHVLVPTYPGYFSFVNANNGRFQPLSNSPYQVAGLVVIVDSAQPAGSILNIGTSTGSSNIALNIPTDTTGWKYPVLGTAAQQVIAAGGWLYASPSNTAPDSFCRVYYVVNLTYADSYGIYNNTQGSIEINGSSITSNISSDCYVAGMGASGSSRTSIGSSYFNALQASTSPKSAFTTAGFPYTISGRGIKWNGAVSTNITLPSDIGQDSLWQANGDLAVASGSYGAIRLAKGNNGQVLSVVAGAVTWADVSMVGGGGNALAIYNNNVFSVTGTALIFNTGLTVTASGSFAYVNATSSGINENVIPVYENSTFKTTGTALIFGSGLSVSVSGSFAYINATSPGINGVIAVYEDSTFKVTGSAISFGSNLNVAVTGTTAFVSSVRTSQVIFTTEGSLVTGTGALRIYNLEGATRTISRVFLSVSAVPDGSSIFVDVNKNGTTIFTTPSNRPQVTTGSYTGNASTIEVPNWADGEYLTVDIDQVGSSVAGSNLTTHIIYSS